MNSLHDQLGEAVADVTADLNDLVGQARQRGLAKRRQRRALSTIGVAAVVAVAATAGFGLRPDNSRTLVASDTSTAPSALPSQSTTATTAGPTVALTGRSTAALFVDLVEDTLSTSIEAGTVRGGGGVALADGGNIVTPATQNEATSAEVYVPTSAGRVLLTVVVNRPNPDGADAQPSNAGTTPWPIPPCTQCKVEELPNGDTLTTNGDRGPVASLLSPRRNLLVTVSARTPSGQTTPVTLDELSIIATSPRWSFQVPESLAQQENVRDFVSMDNGDDIHAANP